jgi:hypothetical protein
MLQKPLCESHYKIFFYLESEGFLSKQLIPRYLCVQSI